MVYYREIFPLALRFIRGGLGMNPYCAVQVRLLNSSRVGLSQDSCTTCNKHTSKNDKPIIKLKLIHINFAGPGVVI